MSVLSYCKSCRCSLKRHENWRIPLILSLDRWNWLCLIKPPSQWPEAKKEVREKICYNGIGEKESPTIRLLNYFSDWSHLKRAVAWSHKFLEVLKWLSERRENAEQTQWTAFLSRKRNHRTLRIWVQHFVLRIWVQRFSSGFEYRPSYLLYKEKITVKKYLF